MLSEIGPIARKRRPRRHFESRLQSGSSKICVEYELSVVAIPQIPAVHAVLSVTSVMEAPVKMFGTAAASFAAAI